MSHCKPYPAYRDSCVGWIGQVPEHWVPCTLKHVLSGTNSGGTPDTDNAEFWGEKRTGTPWVAISDMSITEMVRDTQKYVTEAGIQSKRLKIFPKGTLLFSMYASLGHVAELDMAATTNQAILGLVPNEGIDQSFLKRWLQAVQPFLIIDASNATQDNLNAEKVRNLPCVKVDLPEQKRIALRIDLETARIDALITKKTRFIELLKEKRQALITHAVTKGLDTNAPMRETGVDWIGEVPEHWVSIKFNHVARVTEGLVDPKESPYKDMVLIAPNHIESGTGKILGLETAIMQNAESGKYTCKKGAVIYSKIRPALAKVAIAPCDCLCSADMYPMDCTDRTYPEWLFYLMLSPPFTSWAILESDRVAMPKINRESLADLRVFLPPMEEQLAAVAWLKAQLEKLEMVSLKTQRSIALIKERRAAFITAAVTGQIDLRESA